MKFSASTLAVALPVLIQQASAAAAAAGNAQTSLTLDPSVIAKGFAQNGQATPEAGQVASLTSTNNFINFCAGKTLTDGKQVKGGSCNPAPMGNIPANTAMPSSKFVSPKNLQNIPENTAFDIKMAIQNMETGHFVNAQTNYFSAPQQLNAKGQIQGHSHVVIQQLTSMDQTTPADPATFAFFLGLNAAADGGVLTASVTKGLGPGVYRLGSINTAANHQPALVPIAQHGMLDDVVYFSVGADGLKQAIATGQSAPAGGAGAGAAPAAAAGNATAAAGAKGSASAGVKGAAATPAAKDKAAQASAFFAQLATASPAQKSAESTFFAAQATESPQQIAENEKFIKAQAAAAAASKAPAAKATSAAKGGKGKARRFIRNQY